MQRRKKNLIVACVVLVAVALAWTSDLRRYAIWMLMRSVSDRETKGYQVSFSADDMYSVEGFVLQGEYSDFTVGNGILVPGRTEVGTTVVLVLGDGEWTVRKPGKYTWSRLEPKSVDTPFREPFSSIYLRIHPGFYKRLIRDASLEKIHDAEAFSRAKEIYRHKFSNSFHMNEKALIPPVDVAMIDVESATWGRLQIHEGIRIGPISVLAGVERWDYEGDPPWYMD